MEEERGENVRWYGRGSRLGRQLRVVQVVLLPCHRRWQKLLLMGAAAVVAVVGLAGIWFLWHL